MPARCHSAADWDPTDEEIQRKPPPGKKHWNVPRRDGHVRLRIEDEDEVGAAGNLQSGAATCGANLSGWRALLAVALTPWLLALALLAEHQLAPNPHSKASSRSEQPISLPTAASIVRMQIRPSAAHCSYECPLFLPPV